VSDLSTTASNPFEDTTGVYLVLRNAVGEYSLWPEFAAIPAGWQCVFGPGPRPDCTEHIERNWTDLSPTGLVPEPGELVS
jgi:MbtH protein